MSEGHETRIRALEIEQGRTAVGLEHLNDTLKELVTVVHDLRDSMNQGKGAIRGATWLWGIVAGGIGATVSWVMTTISRSP